MEDCEALEKDCSASAWAGTPITGSTGTLRASASAAGSSGDQVALLIRSF